MIQVFPKVCFGLGYNTSSLLQYTGIVSGNGALTDSSTISTVSLMAAPGRFKRLTLYDSTGISISTLVQVFKNGVDMGVSAGFDAGAVGRQTSSLKGQTFTWNEGDLVYLRFSNSDLLPAFGEVIGISCELEVDLQLFSLGMSFWSGGPGPHKVGGAFGNGSLDDWSGLQTDMGPTYSIAGLNGRVVRLALRRNNDFGTPTGGEWASALIKNKVLQNGSGGTVDTVLILPDATVEDYLRLDVNLPFSIGDAASAVTTHNVTSANNSGYSIGVAVQPDRAGEFMFCGGSDNSGIGDEQYIWNRVGGTTLAVGSAPIGQRGVTVRGIYVERGVAVGGDSPPGAGNSNIYTVVRDGVLTDVTATQADAALFAQAGGLAVRFPAGSLISLFNDDIGAPDNTGARIHWGIGASIGGVIGPLAWYHRRKRLTNGTQVETVHSDWDMICPPSWYDGFKESDVIEFGDAERVASDPVTGDWSGATFRLRQADVRRELLEEFSSQVFRYWVGNCPVYMTTRENRAQLGDAYCVFNGPIVDATPQGDLSWEITLGDIISRQLLSEQAMIPWKQFKDSNLSEFIEVAESLDREAPEQIILGQHRRVPDVDPPSPQGFIYTPPLLGKIDVGGDAYWCWQIAGMAVADVPDAYTIDPAIGPNPSSILAGEGTIWLVPHHTGHDTAFGAAYQDVTSDTYGNLRRVTRIYGKVGEADPDACATGTLILAVAVDGMEPNGDGTGDVELDRIQQYKWLAINHLAHSGAASYQSGPYLDNPEWDLPEGSQPIINEDSFDDASGIAALRLPEVHGSPVTYQAGYIGAGIIGANSGDRLSAPTLVANMNVSCGVRQGIDHFGRFTVAMLHPTQDVKDAAPLITDLDDILKGSFQTPVGWTEQANRIPFMADLEHVTGRWMTTDAYSSDAAIANYDRTIPSDVRQYRFAPGITMAFHLARITGLEVQHPPRYAGFEGTIGPDPNGDSLGYLDLFDYVRYRHFASISDSVGQIRLGWILRHQVQAGRRRVKLLVWDVEDLINYDAPPAAESAPGVGSPGLGSPALVDGPFGPTADIGEPAPGYVEIAAGSTTSSRQTLIDANPEDTVFWLRAGTHTADGVNTPKTGDIFQGEFGAIIDGSGWSSSTGTDAAFRALNEDIDNVTFRNLVIRNMPQKAISSFHDFSSGWVIEYCEIDHNLYGVEFSTANTIRHNYIHHNLNVDSPVDPDPALRGGGYVGFVADDTVFDHNEIAYNGFEQKVSQSNNVIFRNNFVHDNLGDGIWYDTCRPADLTIDNNICKDNGRAGIDIEACSGTNLVQNNQCQGNQSGVFLFRSEGVEVVGNLLDGNTVDQVDLFWDFANVGAGEDLINNSIHNNTIIVPVGALAVILSHVGSGDDTPYLNNSKNNDFESNSYIVTTLGGNYWYWGAAKNFTQWQAIPQDASGAVSTP